LSFFPTKLGLKPELGALVGRTRCQKIKEKPPTTLKKMVKKDPPAGPPFLSYLRVYVIPLLAVFDIPILVGNNVDTPTVYFKIFK
jgi:hypothetical protein